MKIDKTVRLGTVEIGGRPADVFCRVKFEGGKLSISGVEGPLRNGNARGSCGQIEMGLGDGSEVKPAPGWSPELIRKFLDLWRAWHLNDMRAGCEHQRARGGVLMEPCPDCGYKYGSAWLKEEVPASVLEFLAGLPNSDKVPAWV